MKLFTLTNRDILTTVIAIVLALTVALPLIVATPQIAIGAGGVIFVDVNATGADNGDTWEDAYNELESALSTASAGDEIWVAKGTYEPTAQTDSSESRTATFLMIDGVAIYGG
ncbi:MAG: hypothetical protein GY845_29210, partial [Planctomycetes bacterium]|nr:hypothetical protein [Planctomycetota bacterium]